MGVIDSIYLPSRQKTEDAMLDAWMGQSMPPSPDIAMTKTASGQEPPPGQGQTSAPAMVRKGLTLVPAEEPPADEGPGVLRTVVEGVLKAADYAFNPPLVDRIIQYFDPEAKTTSEAMTDFFREELTRGQEELRQQPGGEQLRPVSPDVIDRLAEALESSVSQVHAMGPGKLLKGAKTPEGAATIEKAMESPGKFNPQRQAGTKLQQLTAEANVAARESGLMTEQTRGSIAHGETLDAAKKLISSGQMTAERLLTFEPGTILNAEEGTAARLIRDAVIARKDQLMTAAEAGDETAKGLIVSAHYLASRIEAITEAASGTEPARALSARRILSRPKGVSADDMLRLLQQGELTPEAKQGIEGSINGIKRTLTRAKGQATGAAKETIQGLEDEVTKATEGQEPSGELLAGVWDIILKGAMKAESQAIDPDLLQMILQRTQDAITNAVPEGHLLGGLWGDLVEGVSHAEATIDPDLLLAFTRQLTTQAEKNAFTKYFAETSRAGRIVDAFLEARAGGLLSHRSLIRNVVGSAAATAWSVPERAITAVMGGPSQGAYTAEAAYLLYGIEQSLKTAIRVAGKAFQTGESQFLSAATQTEQRYLSAMSSEALGVHGLMGRAIDVWGEIARFWFRGMVAGDDFFKFINFDGEKYAQAYRRYRQLLSSGASEATAAQEYASLIEHPPAWLRKASEEHSLYTTFNDELINPGAKAIMQIRNDEGPVGKIARFIVPFARTPMNVMSYGAERTPGLNFLSSHFWQELNAGGVRADAAAARLALGSTVYLVMASLAGNGYITGKGPKDPKLREQYIQSGWKPYSVWIPTVGYVSYLGYEPLSTVMAQSADFAELVMQGAEWPSLMQMATASVLSTLEFMEEQPMLQGVAQVVAAIQQQDARAGQALSQFLASNFPLPGIQGIARTLTEQTDPYLRDVRGPPKGTNWLAQQVNDLFDELASRTPWLTNYLYPQRDIMGRPMLRQGGWWTLFPSAPSAQTPHPVLDEINKQGITIGKVPKALGQGRQALTFVGYDPDRMAIPLQPDEWDRWQSLSHQPPGYTKTLPQALQELIDSRDYQQGGDGPRGTKAAMIKEVFQEYRQAARDELETLGPKDAGGMTALQRALERKRALLEFEKLDKAEQERERPALEQMLGRPTKIGILR